MRIVGLTGGIASGKSTVARLLEKLGALIIDTDKLAREVVRPGTPALQAIVGWLGPGILRGDGTLDREAVARVVFSDRDARARLEAITHPAIRSRVEQAVAEAGERGVRVVVLDVPLLFEVGWSGLVDETWVVWVDRPTQESRLTRRDTLSREDAVRRIDSQLSLDEKAARATTVIDNRGDFAATKEQVEAAWRRTLAASGS